MTFKIFSTAVLIALGSINLHALEGQPAPTSRTQPNVQIKQDGSKFIQNSDGTTVQIYPDGTQIIKKPDGTTVHIMPNGSKVIKKSDGTSVEVNRP